jgi:hypothetical protein
MTQEVVASTFIEFSRTLVDTKSGFTVTIYIKLGEEGVIIGHEFGSGDGMTNSSAQGRITLESLKKLLDTCRKGDIDGVGVETVMKTYDTETRELDDEIEDLQISFQEPMNFRPFLQQFLPIIIKSAELLDKDALPVTMNATPVAKC